MKMGSCEANFRARQHNNDAAERNEKKRDMLHGLFYTRKGDEAYTSAGCLLSFP
jgi:hypothetical protein